MIRIPFDQVQQMCRRVLESRNMSEEDALLCSRLIAQTSLEGVYTHGLNRFPWMIRKIDAGNMLVDKHAQKVGSFGVLERWDGMGGVGNLNAHTCMQRAIALAKEHTIGCVALKNTTHWMRPGTYGLMAAEAGCIGILWTNTMPLMPAWGATNATVGNNPLVLAIPNKDEPVLVDMAMSLFSYGKLETYAREERELPVPGGYDEQGNLTTDAKKIMEIRRPLPVGFWKGTSLALALDLIAAALSGGATTRRIGLEEGELEASQVFFAIDISAFPDRKQIEEEIAASLAQIKDSKREDPSVPIRFPGEKRLALRQENLELGIPVDERIWDEICSL
ncbi:MAG: 3-dehydro-L-gulonate 2-dehydrogenase [Sphaerochaeta sp.]|uniref:3-dehydro-L-gulonate 2-dehydrogenase n=1 Tax=Sphaerochaeta sp. TaxID=1972642 RepID=UPI002979E43F|nr:3-dehydro-L-gulonate 2-dehydrogenase [Sphaerochaeta sp.]